MFLFPFFRRLMPSRRFMTRLAVLALLINALSLGLHHSPGALAAFAAPGMACSDPALAGDTDREDEKDASHPVPGHAGMRCPFCILADGGKLLPPAPILVFPPASTPAAIKPPPSHAQPAALVVAAHRPRAPPVEN